MIRVSGLRKTFGEVIAVDDVSFAAEDGAITGLLGPNGAGKSTTLRMLYGLMAPEAGEVAVDGVDVQRRTMAAQERIGALPDTHALYPRLTGRENIRYFARLRGIPVDVTEGRLDEFVRLLEMADFVDRRAKGYSHGERSRVLLARALIHEPRNVLLDEPTNGLDVMSTRRMRDLIRELRGRGCAVLFSSHIMQEVSLLCDHIVIVAAGRVVAAGSPNAIRETAGCEDLEDAFVRLTGPQEDGA
ncbi:MAG: ATP-binding cassette domain-containing protein [Acidobacteriota bacterium]|nr:ATP-binding cassette domain-containing protein [Acidobacteriota bacterium]MDE2970709.1 ATP-binding cassette domain-containing protein [Acidobacteriota bacterium]MDE3261454.1 ATP-binding cassette domain-containing protein [Acidobacteriota bacterium]